MDECHSTEDRLPNCDICSCHATKQIMHSQEGSDWYASRLSWTLQSCRTVVWICHSCDHLLNTADKLREELSATVMELRERHASVKLANGSGPAQAESSPSLPESGPARRLSGPIPDGYGPMPGSGPALSHLESDVTRLEICRTSPQPALTPSGSCLSPTPGLQVELGVTSADDVISGRPPHERSSSPLVCGDCGLCFRSARMLDRHRRLHGTSGHVGDVLSADGRSAVVSGQSSDSESPAIDAGTRSPYSGGTEGTETPPSPSGESGNCRPAGEQIGTESCHVISVGSAVVLEALSPDTDDPDDAVVSSILAIDADGAISSSVLDIEADSAAPSFVLAIEAEEAVPTSVLDAGYATIENNSQPPDVERNRQDGGEREGRTGGERGAVAGKRKTEPSYERVGDKWKCITCSALFSSRTGAHGHAGVHSDPDGCRCPRCHKTYANVYAYRRHREACVGGRAAVCAVCSKVFSDAAYLKRHALCHADSVPRRHQCELCGLAFRAASELRDHAATAHSHAFPHGCDICRRQFKLQSQLRRHRRSAHAARPAATCDVCGRGFRRADHLRAHVTVHTGARPHVCAECGRGFSRADTLADHARIHSGEKPFSCRYCGAAFREHRGYRQHVRKHAANGDTVLVDAQSAGAGSGAAPLAVDDTLSSAPDWD